jgi:hypothetical protein
MIIPLTLTLSPENHGGEGDMFRGSLTEHSLNRE